MGFLAKRFFSARRWEFLGQSFGWTVVFSIIYIYIYIYIPTGALAGALSPRRRAFFIHPALLYWPFFRAETSAQPEVSGCSYHLAGMCAVLSECTCAYHVPGMGTVLR